MYTYSNKRFLIKEEIFRNGGTKIIYEYSNDENGNIVKRIEKYYYENGVLAPLQERSCKYEFDYSGNWIRKVEDNYDHIFVKEREIIYFQDKR